MGPKCHVAALDPHTGALKWAYDLVSEFGTTVPPWYAGQCPLIDDGKVLLAPAGTDVLMVAADVATGQILWRATNAPGWKMTHASITPVEFAGQKIYVYCGHGGVAGVSSTNGAVLWQTSDWKISIATVPSPVAIPGGRIFLSGGYNAGSAMLQLVEDAGKISVRTLYRLEAEVFGATQQTPIYFDNHIYGVRPDNRLVCLSLDGKVMWTSEPGQSYGLGPFLIADSVVLAVNDNGLLRMVEAAPDKYRLLAQSQVLTGRESWGPLALGGGRLIVRDLTRMVCLDLNPR
jgi:outer membrane protein assembly factor BamB